jgi:CRISPR-associated protein Cmr2
MADTQYFHFTLGPVQSFVAQARRTRDFWAGSFLLSWLSAVAMREVEQQKGEIVFPELDDAFRRALTREPLPPKEQRPQQGSVPNRFKAKVNGQFDPDKVVEAVRHAWRALADKVWDEDLKAVDRHINGIPKSKHAMSKTERLWRNQVNSFWDMSWCLSASPLDGDLLDRRKNWRSYLPPPQSGLKCALLEGWQEISGAKRRGEPGEPGAKSAREVADTFWKAVRNGKSMGLDIKEDEFLCAIAFIKRRFHRHFSQLAGIAMPGGWTLCGWELGIHVPSVTFVAAAHWLAELIEDKENVPKDTLEALHKCGVALAKGDEEYSAKPYGEWNTEIRCVEDALKNRPDALKNRPDAPRRLARLDGSVFFPDLYESHHKEAGQKEKDAMRAALSALKRGAPPPFYALLLMDGDSLGKMLSGGNADDKADPDTLCARAETREKLITAALGHFTRQVPATVDKHNGFLIYAGGDDVLALLPAQDALECARELHEDYARSFRRAHGQDKPLPDGEKIKGTISAAVQFIHVNCPLTRVLRDAHTLLDDVAKDGCGRDALAVRVVKPGGVTLQWAMPWNEALDTGSEIPRLKLTRIAQRFSSDMAKDTGFSSKFFYGVREIFSMLIARETGQDGKQHPVSLLEPEDFQALFWADYLASGINREQILEAQAEARADLKILYEQCQPKKRVGDSAKPVGAPCADAALLVRFIASKGVLA